MTIKVKKTWLLIHWNNLKKLKNTHKRYVKKMNNLGLILQMGSRFKIELPEVYQKWLRISIVSI